MLRKLNIEVAPVSGEVNKIEGTLLRCKKSYVTPLGDKFTKGCFVINRNWRIALDKDWFKEHWEVVVLSSKFEDSGVDALNHNCLLNSVIRTYEADNSFNDRNVIIKDVVEQGCWVDYGVQIDNSIGYKEIIGRTILYLKNTYGNEVVNRY